MNLSIFELYKIGVGPSSSHSVGPLRAAKFLCRKLKNHGLFQIPCIERNAMAAVKAVTASRIALSRQGRSYVTLDQVISTMQQTGRDMMSKYKETSTGGLAINITEC